MLQHLLNFDFTVRQHKHLLCCPNGMVDLKTGTLLGPPTPDHFCTQLCATEYDPNADMQPAIAFFEQFFPEGAYTDHTELVAFLQQYLGYSLTLETNLQFCLFIYGRGSNGKSDMMKALIDVLGKTQCKTIPVESLSKARGQNNDSLKDARHARLVLLSESNGAANMDIATFNAIVCGEETTVSAKYEKENNFIPQMKLTFFLNTLPEWTIKDAFHIARRCAYLPMKKIFVDKNREADRTEVERYKLRGEPDCLIGEKDSAYYERCVTGNEKSFLRFFVEGARTYYNNGKNINIPQSMQHQAKCEGFDKKSAVEQFVDERLVVSHEGKELVADLYTAFLVMFPDDVNYLSYKDSDFGKDLLAIITEHKKNQRTMSDWDCVRKINGRKNGSKGVLYEHLLLRPQ